MNETESGIANLNARMRQRHRRINAAKIFAAGLLVGFVAGVGLMLATFGYLRH